MATTAGSATATLPYSNGSHEHDGSWSIPAANNEAFERNHSVSSHPDRAYNNSTLPNGFEPLGEPADRSARKMQSNDNFHDDETANGYSAYGHLEGQSYHKSTEAQRRNAAQAGLVPGEDDKWIHRDKLAKIESEELQAAGFFVPRSRAPSKQRRDRSQVSYRRGTDASERGTSRSRKNSTAVEHRSPADPSPPAWDLRTPEEIAAEEDSKAYFTAHSQKGGSRIPVAKTSVVPIPSDHLERPVPAMRTRHDSSESDTVAYPQSRSRSASASGKEILNNTLQAPKRTATDISPRKGTAGTRKASAVSKPPTSSVVQSGRPKTRSGSGNSTRPSTRSGEKQLEGDPPWMVNSYKPDPRLPPDQQLLPTVARRLQQEQWEKNGKFGDVYDKEFRPLNDSVFLKPAEPDTVALEDEPQPQPQHEQMQASDEWPLKPEAVAKSPTLRQGSYSTMPKISDKPANGPMASPRAPMSPPPQMQMQAQPPTDQRQSLQRPEQELETDPEPKKGGCGCCVVM